MGPITNVKLEVYTDESGRERSRAVPVEQKPDFSGAKPDRFRRAGATRSQAIMVRERFEGDLEPLAYLGE